MARSSATSALRKMFDEGVSLSSMFNAERAGLGQNVAEQMKSGQSAAGQAKAGQVSAVGLRPLTLEEKLHTLKQMLAKGKIKLANRVSLDTVRHEMQKPENNGLGINELVEVLTKKKLLASPKAPSAVLTMKL